MAAEAVGSGLRPVPAVRSAEKLARTARPWGLEARTVVVRDLEIGHQTPSSAYGADFVRQFEGVEWELLES